MTRTLASLVVFSLLAGCGGSSDSGAFDDPGDGAVDETSGDDSASGDTTPADASPSDGSDDTSAPADSASGDGGLGDGSTDGVTADSASCMPGATQEEGCGKCGKHLRVCNTSSVWSDWSSCSGETGACLPGATDTQLCVDGRMQARTCDATCTWSAFGACMGTPTCTPGATENDGCGNCGNRVRVCSSSKTWSDWSSCTEPAGACTPGATQDMVCFTTGKQTRTCSTSCTWGAYGTCVGGTVPCSPGATENQACGFCGDQVRVCGSDAKWSDWSTCSGAGACASGTTDTISCGTTGGTKTRTCSATCAWSPYSLCSTDLDNQVWVLRVNAGSTVSAAAPVFVDRIGLDGSYIGSFTLPTTTTGTTHALTLPADDLANDGHLSRSADGRYIVFAGYDAAVGTADVENGTSARTIGVIDATGTIDTSRTTTAIGSRARGASTSDGSIFWIFGLDGLYHYPSGTLVTSNPIRAAQVVEGSLWISGVTNNLGKFTGLPTTSATETALASTSAFIYSPGAFFTVARAGGTVDTAYVADDGASGGPTSGVVRLVRTGTTWAMSSTLPVNLASGEHMEWITGRVEGSNVVIWGSVVGSGASRIVKLTDVGGTTTTFTATTVYTAPSGRKLRGIAFPPR
ncbi:MAG: hypothetical protein ACXVEE_24180 [Polyangiales bacterium]